MLVQDLPVRRIHTPIGRHSLPPIFLSGFVALVLMVRSLMDVCRNQATKTVQDHSLEVIDSLDSDFSDGQSDSD